MPVNKYLIALSILLFGVSVNAQITSFAGVTINGSLSSTRAATASYLPGYSGGIDYILWEYPEWYLKTGLHISFRNSAILEIPKYFDVSTEELFTPTDIQYSERNLLIPIQGFFPLLNRKENTLLIGAGLEMMYTIREKYIHDNFGEVSFQGEDIDKPFKTGVMLGAGYQRELSDIMFLSVYPSVNLDVKADRPFTSFELTLELFYGVY